MSTGDLQTVCMKAEGSAGGVLFVSDYPGKDEDRIGRPFVGESGRLLRGLIQKFWSGPVAFDNAIHCKVGTREVRDTHVNACRPYLALTLDEVKPTRIVVMGSQAIFSVLGRRVPPLSARHGFTWLTKPKLTPVFLLMNPVMGIRNDFLKAWFKEDLEWALTTDVETLKATIPWDSYANIVETAEDAEKAYDHLRHASRLTYDCETAGLLFEDGRTKGEPAFRVLCVAVHPGNEEDSWVWSEEALRDPDAREFLKALMEDASIPKVGQNEKYDHNTLIFGLDIHPRGVVADTRLQRKLIDGEADADLEVMQELVGMGGGKDEIDLVIKKITRTCRKKKATPIELADLGDHELVNAIRYNDREAKAYAYGLVDRDLLYRYCATDTLSTDRLVEKFSSDIASVPQLTRVWNGLVLPASLVVAQIERWGVGLNRDAVEAFETLLLLRKDEVAQRLAVAAPGVNFDSVVQLQKLLFIEHKLKPVKRTKKGSPSTDEESLKALSKKSNLVADILELRKVSKMIGTYASGMLPHIRSDNKIHASFLLDGTRSGRLSSASPNLQNLARADTPEGKMSRDCFVADPGWRYIEFDYKQLEICIAAMLSKDPTMREIILSGEDFHLKTAKLVAKIMGVDPEQITKEHPLRTTSKVINFGTLYGQGAAALAAQLGIKVDQAEMAQRAIMGKFNVLAKWIKDCVAYSKRSGVVWTWWDGHDFRRRPLWRIVDKDDESRGTAERGAFNSRIQGTGSEFLVHSMVAVVSWILGDSIPARVLAPIHDSLWMEVRDDFIEEVCYVVPKIMSGWNSDGIPLGVDIKMGPSFGSMEKYKPTA